MEILPSSVVQDVASTTTGFLADPGLNKLIEMILGIILVFFIVELMIRTLERQRDLNMYREEHHIK